MRRFNVTPLGKVLVIMSLPLALAACRGRAGDAAHGAQPTQTIAPAAAQPAPNGNDAMTQTVDVEDSRSEAEGGVMTAPAPKAPAVKKAAPPAKKKK